MKYFKIKKAFVLLYLLLVPALFARTGAYRLSWREDPAHSMVIGWNQYCGRNASVYYGEQDHGKNWKAYPVEHKVDRVSHYGLLQNNFARLTGLNPDCAYYFVIKDSNSISARMWFKTAPNQIQPISFIAGGDSRNNQGARQKGNRIVAKLRPLFILFGGDYTVKNSPMQWAQWLKDWQLTISADGRIYPIIAAHGNHENSDMQVEYKLFDTPHRDGYYAFSFGGDLLKIWTINTELEPYPLKWKQQLNWLTKDLAASKNYVWKIVDYHRPMRPHYSKKAEGLTQIEAWANLFYQNQVDLVVESDTHMVKRTWPIRPSTQNGSDQSFIRDDKNGTVYIGEGSWGAPTRSADDDKAWTRDSDSFHQFKWIHIYAWKLESRVVMFDGSESAHLVSEEHLLEVPEGLKLWEPENGAVLQLRPRLSK